MSLEVGDSLAPLDRTIDRVSMVAYAGATWDWHRMHWDRDHVEALGFDAPVVDGQVFGALLVEHLQDELGPRAFVRRLAFRFRSLVHADETVHCQATITALAEDDDGLLVEAAHEITAGDGRLAVTATSTTLVRS